MMKKNYLLWIFSCAALLITGCDSPKRTVGIVQKQITEFKANPDNARQVAIEQSLAKLDSQIDRMQENGKTADAEIFRRQATNLRSEFQAARMARALNDARNAIQGMGEAFKEAGKSFSETLQNISKETNE